MGEELDGLDVGIAVNDPPCHHGASFRLGGGDIPQPGDKIALHADIEQQPDQHRQHHAPVGLGDHHHHGGEVDQDVDQHIEQLHHGFAHRQRGLHYLGGDATGEVIAIEGDALLEQVTVGQPADHHGIVAEQGLMDQQRMDGDQDGQADQHQQRHPQQAGALVGEQRLRIVGNQPIDQLAEKAKQRDFGDGDEGGQHRHRQ